MKIFLMTMTLAFVALIGSPAHAADPIYTGKFSNNAVSGYDAVSYFSTQGPVKGSSEFTTKWKGATWRFSNADNLAKFKANPTKYAPQYGGYCSWAASQGKLAKGDPKQWHIENGKLYLNVNANIKKKWLANKAQFIRDADSKFPSLIK